MTNKYGERMCDTEMKKEAGGGWRPIETAPKDGTRVLLFDVKKLQWPKVGYSMGNGYWWTEPGAYQIQPTHWQPLPPPPA